MPWIAVDDAFYDHPKFVRAGPLGIALWLAGLAFCNRNLTDGLIPHTKVAGLLAWEFQEDTGHEIGPKVWTISVGSGMSGEEVTPEFVTDLLVKSGLWEQERGGYRIHDYHAYQPTKEKVLAQRATTANRVRRWRGNGTSNGVTNTVSNGSVTGAPLPNPNPKNQEKEISLATLARPAESPGTLPKARKRIKAELPEGFAAWYAAYPHKVKPDDAARAYRSVLDPGCQQFVLDGTRAWIEHWTRESTERTFIPYPASFLRAGQWRTPPPDAHAIVNGNGRVRPHQDPPPEVPEGWRVSPPPDDAFTRENHR